MFLLIAIVLTILSIVVIGLKFDIRSDLKDLMPEDAQSVTDTFEISDRMGSIQSLAIYIEMPELKAVSAEERVSERYAKCVNDIHMSNGLSGEKPPIGEHWCDTPLVLFGHDFVEEVNKLDSVGNVAFYNDKSFFENNIMLYASANELEQAYDQIDKMLTEARQQTGEYKACLIAESDPSACDDLKPGVKKQVAGASSDERYSPEDMLRQRYAESELSSISTLPLERLSDGTWLLRLNVRFKNSTTSLKAVKKEVERIDKIVEALGMTQNYDASLKLVYGGGLDDMKAEYNAIIKDITMSISFTILSIFALIAIFFRSARAAIRIFVPLLMSTIWSLAMAFLTVGYLNIITAFIFALLLGLGIDFGIHLYARFNHERLAGVDTTSAMITSVVETGSPIFYGALTTSVVFFTLMLGSFKGFTEFGFVAGIGVLFAFVTMCSILPAMTLVMERKWPSKLKPRKTLVQLTAAHSKRFSLPIIVVSLLAIGGGVYCATCINNILFEESFYRLKMRATSDTQQISKTTRYRKASLRPTSPTYALMNDPEEVAALDMIIRRDREYTSFQKYRRLGVKMPHTLSYLDEQFGEILPYLGQARSISMYAALGDLLPYDNIAYTPLFVTYGKEKSAYLRKIRNFAFAYPNAAERLSDMLPELLSENSVMNALPAVSLEQGFLPESLWAAIPTQRNSKQYNTISDFQSIFSYLPGTEMQQQERLALIQKIGERVSDRNIRFLPSEEKEKIKEFRDKFIVREALHVDDLPDWVKLQFKENGLKPHAPREGSGVDYAFGNVAILYQATSTYEGQQAHMLTRDVRSIRVGDERVVASTSAFVYSDMLKLVKTDGVKTSMLALILILLIVFIQQRNPIRALIIAIPVTLGLGTTIAFMSWCNLKLGLFNIVMLPVTLGIGIDGAIYLFQRYQALGRGSALESVKQVGGSVFMSSATTVVGFGGMMFSQHMGLNSMGQLAVIGISFCFCSTFLIEPGLIILCEKVGLKSITDHDFDPNKAQDQASDPSGNVSESGNIAQKC